MGPTSVMADAREDVLNVSVRHQVQVYNVDYIIL